jgi:uncharacterized protein YdhG (YjbR/CyaY superfamily)
MTDTQKVTNHISKLDADFATTIEYLRQVILKIDAEIAEQIKWNNPCFNYSGEMKAFKPKEYKREIIVFNLHKNKILLVLPTGSKITKNTALLEGDYIDGRRLIKFMDLEDIKSKVDLLQKLITEWLELVEKEEKA